MTWVLWPVPVAAFVLYPLAKRVTWACHLALGLTIGMAPMGAWLAVTGGLGRAPVMLGLASPLWIAGFDIIYALLDVEFDRATAIHSVPARFGEARALWFTRVLHVRPSALLAGPGSWRTPGRSTWPASPCAPRCCCARTRSSGPGDVGRIQAAFASRTACSRACSCCSPSPR